MKQLWLVGLAVGLAGCAQHAELAPRENATPPGPFTLRYQFDPQHPERFHITATGDTTTSFNRSATSTTTTPETTSPPAGTAPGNNAPGATAGSTPREAVHANFQTDMVVARQETPAAPNEATDSGSGTGSATAGGTASSGATSTAPSASEATGTNSPAAGTNTPAAGENEPSSAAGTTGANSAGSTAATAGTPMQISQNVDQWNATVTLPDRQAPNQFQGEYSNKTVTVTTSGIPLPVPDRYKQQVQASLAQPVTAVVTDLGEVKSVTWNSPPMATPTGQSGNDARPISFLTRATGALNLWVGLVHLPDHPVNVGDSWDARDSFPVTMGTVNDRFHLERSGHYILRNVTQSGSDQQAVIDANETLKLLPGPVPPAAASTSDGSRSDTAGTGASSSAGPAAGTSSGATAGNSPDSGTSESEANPPSGGASAGATSSATAGEGNAIATQTRSGSVFFNITRGYVDHADEQFTLNWTDRFMNGTMTSTAAPAAGAEGQAQGRLTAQRVDTGYSLAPIPGSTSSTTAGNGNTPANGPAANAPAANAPPGQSTP